MLSHVMINAIDEGIKQEAKVHHHVHSHINDIHGGGPSQGRHHSHVQEVFSREEMATFNAHFDTERRLSSKCRTVISFKLMDK